MSVQYEIAENDRNLLLQALGLPESGPDGQPTEVPAHVSAAYLRYRRIHDRLGGGEFYPSYVLAWIVLSAGEGAPTPAEAAAESVISLYEREAMRYGDPVVATWRKRKVRGICQGITDDRRKMLVQLDGDSELREFSPEDVSLPEPEMAQV